MTEEHSNLFGIEKLNVPRSELPAITHVDYSARVQTVHQDTAPRYHALIKAFEAKNRLRSSCKYIIQCPRRTDRSHT